MVAIDILGVKMPPLLPYDVARCVGVSYIEDGVTEWREGCEHCLRRTAPPSPAPDQRRWVEPPPIITFVCEYLLEDSDA